MDRAELRRAVSGHLEGRQLVYFGTRGSDAEGVGDQPELAAVFSIIAAHRSRSGLVTSALEDLTGRRVDLDSYDIDEDLQHPGVVELRRQILRTLSRPSVVFTYRPSTFLSAIYFARSAQCQYAGLFAGHQSAFEHKPWVESAVRSMGIPTIDWHYLADEDQIEALHYLADGPVVLRRSRSSGGTGLTRIDSRSELQQLWPEQDEAFVSVSPYIPDGLPANVSGVVWKDGVTLHGASVQLIGVPGLTDRPFGYCGNDFAAAKTIGPQVLNQMEGFSHRIGLWLGSFGYLGAFGVDFLIDGDQALFTEVNPRLQGVTHLECQVAAGDGRSCVLLEHLASQLGVPVPTEEASLAQQVAEAPDVAHLVLHRTTAPSAPHNCELLSNAIHAWPSLQRVDVLCPEGVEADPGATLARVTVRERLTSTGFDLVGPWAGRVRAAISERSYEHL